MLVTLEWIKINFDKFNEMLWDGKLPTPSFRINMSRRTWGRASYRTDRKNNCLKDFEITISNYYDSPEYVKENTLIHEMIHLADYVFNPWHFLERRSRRYDSHGSLFFIPECKRIAEYGYNITKKVTEKEYSDSQLSDKAKIKLEKHANYYLYVGTVKRTVTKDHVYDFTAVKPIGGLPTRKSYNITRLLQMENVILVRTSYHKLATKRGKSNGGWYLTAQMVDEIMETAEVIMTNSQLKEQYK